MRSSLCTPATEPRRRSVHFDAAPSTIIASAAHDAGDECAGGQAAGGGQMPSRHCERRKSAPASALLGVGDAGLAQLDPDLRKSLSKLCCTTLEDPDEDLDVINVKLLGRDELEILRLKQIKEAGDSIEASESEEEEEEEMASAQELSALIQRLEAVAVRLEKAHGAPNEDLRAQIAALRASGTSGPLKALRDCVERVEAKADTHNNQNNALSASIPEYDAILTGPFMDFMAHSEKIGGDVATIANMVSEAFNTQRGFLALASKAKQPSQTELQELLKPTSDKIGSVNNFREANRRSPFFNHLSAVSESISALGWVAVAPAPAPYVKEMNDAGQFYTNRVLKDFKEKDKVHVAWVKAWIATLTELQTFVKQHHTTGLVWNPKGVDAKSIAKGSGPAPAASAGGPPLPPPPPPPGLFDDLKVAAADPEKQARGALFAELNKGDDVTKGLKKVTADMQTHKNPGLRETGPVPAKPTIAPKPQPAKAAAAADRPPKFQLEGKKWAVEYFKGNPNIVIDQVESNQSVYIYRCEGSTVRVNGKCNNIVLDSCKKTAVVFDNVLSSCEFINCQSVQMQVLGTVPTISVDKTDGCQMFLSKDSLAVEIVTAKSSEMNVMIPTGEDFVEQPVPEQFKTTVAGAKLSTVTAESV